MAAWEELLVTIAVVATLRWRVSRTGRQAAPRGAALRWALAPLRSDEGRSQDPVR